VKLTAELLSTGKNTAGFEIDESFVRALGGGGRPKVAVTINGHTFRTSIARMGGRYLLGLSADRRAEAEVAPGEVLELDIVLDEQPREVVLPDDLADALAADPAAADFWQTLSYSNQRWHVEQITGAKKAETRAGRVTKSISMLRESRAR
jgi:hypothetical protein